MSKSEPGQTTLHLCPATVWAEQRSRHSYLPEAFGQDGFIHCTDGDAMMIDIANRFYSGDPRDFLVLTVDLIANGEPWRYDDPEQRFPHIYGPLHPSAVRQIRTINRDSDGRFLGFGAAVID